VFVDILKIVDLIGPLVYISVLGQGILFLNDAKTVDDLLNRRGTIYGDRPRWIGM
jgi:hypothetical protein